MVTQHPSPSPQPDTLPPTYVNLFKEQWDRLCPASSLAAVDSPVAYLHALYAFAIGLEGSEDERKNKLTLDKRRPDLASLVIDEAGLTAQVPQLSIINETLARHLAQHLKRNAQEHHADAITRLLRETRYPFALPFELAHRQCWLSLAADKPQLGEISYRISVKLPLGQRAQNLYGVFSHPAYEAQRLMSGLSPAQQSLLTEPFTERPEAGKAQAFFQRHYGAREASLATLHNWLQCTELSADQNDALLACGKYRPVLSANVAAEALPAPLEKPRFQPGAAYVNGPITAASATQPALKVEADPGGAVLLNHTSWNRYERLHRMIRLQRWLQLPFDQLDGLLVSVARCEQECEPSAPVNDNILRALGVYRYLHRRHGLQLQELTALLDELPVRAPATRMSLFDEVFNHPRLPGSPLRVAELDFNPDTPLPDAVRQRLCAALGLHDSADSLGWLLKQVHLHLKPPCPTLTVYCALYRQARIARLFGLSVLDSYHLAELLGGADHTRQLVSPSLRRSNVNVPADLLDVLMQMDWLVGWLKDSRQTVEQLRRQLILDPEAQPAPVRLHLTQLQALVELTRTGLLAQADIDDLTLPQPEANTQAAPIRWHEIIVHGLLHSHPLLKWPAPKELPKGLLKLIENQTLSSDAHRDADLKEEARQAIGKKLGAFYRQLQPLKEKIDALFDTRAHLSYDPALSLQSRKHAARQIIRAASAPSSTRELAHLLLSVPDADVFLGLPVSRQALHTFLLNPEWLSQDQPTSTGLPLTLNTLYLLQRFEHCLNTYGLSEDLLLTYLQRTNAPAAAATSVPRDTAANQQLAAMLNWDLSEVEQLIDHLPTKHVQSMADLDWIIRCHAVAGLTGLSAKALLKAADLHATLFNDDWEHVGAALMASAH